MLFIPFVCRARRLPNLQLTYKFSCPLPDFSLVFLFFDTLNNYIVSPILYNSALQKLLVNKNYFSYKTKTNWNWKIQSSLYFVDSRSWIIMEKVLRHFFHDDKEKSEYYVLSFTNVTKSMNICEFHLQPATEGRVLTRTTSVDMYIRRENISTLWKHNINHNPWWVLPCSKIRFQSFLSFEHSSNFCFESS